MRVHGISFKNGDREIFVESDSGDSRQYLEPPKTPKKVRQKVADVELVFKDNVEGKKEIVELLDRLKLVLQKDNGAAEKVNHVARR